jgi:spore photoproduct lyase
LARQGGVALTYGIHRVRFEKGTDANGFGRTLLKSLSGMTLTEFHTPVDDDLPDLQEGKRTLELSFFPGEPLKKCPGTKGYICCNYRIFHVGANCPMDCSYCILQAYLNQPHLRIFTNLEEKLAALGAHLDSHPEEIFRIGTGEFMDSLALDPIAGWSDLLLPFFSGRKNAILELKTKTVHVERLLASPYRDGIVISWSLNSPLMAEREEHGAPPIRKRIEAAKRCQEEGFLVGFHFDPLVPHPDWKDGYTRTLEMIINELDPGKILWISLGCIRYLPALKAIIRKRHPGSVVLDGEFVPGLDGKMRLFKPVRIEMYGHMAERLNRWHKELGLYLCMESQEVWREALGWDPGDSQGLSTCLDQRVKRLRGW